MSREPTPSLLQRIRDLPRNVKLLGLASLLNDIASEIIFPLMPRFLREVLHGSVAYLGLIEGLADTTASLLKLWSGGRSDQTGRRHGMVVVGYALTALVRPLVGLATAPWQALTVKLVDRVGKGIRTAPRDALLADSTPVEIRGWAFGFHRSMDHLGAAVGPLLATLFLLAWPGELRWLFGLTIIPGLAVVALLWFGLREPVAETPPVERLHFNLQPFDARFKRFLVAMGLFSLGNSTDAFLLLRAGDLGVPAAGIPLLWLMFHLLKSGGTMLAGPWIDRVGPRPLIFCGWAIYAVVYLGFAVATRAWHAWGLFAVYSVFYCLAEPAEKTLVTQLAGRAGKGLAFGWFHLVTGLAALPASVVFGLLWDHYGAGSAFVTGAALAALGAAVLFTVRDGGAE